MLRAFEQGELEESPIPPDRRQELLEAATYKSFGQADPQPPTPRIQPRASPLSISERCGRHSTMPSIRSGLTRRCNGDNQSLPTGILPPGMPGYNPEVQGYSYDPDKAKATTGAGGPPGWKESARDAVNSRNQQDIARGASTRPANLAVVGVQVELQRIRRLADLPTGTPEQGMCRYSRYTWYADYPDPDSFLYPLFHSQSQTNYFRYHNPAVDQLLDEARRETDDLRRVDLYRRAEQLILQ